MLYRDLQSKLRDLYTTLQDILPKLTRKIIELKKDLKVQDLLIKTTYKLQSPYIEYRIAAMLTLAKIIESKGPLVTISVNTNLDFSYIHHIIEYITASELLQLAYKILHEDYTKTLGIELLLSNIDAFRLQQLDKLIRNSLYASRIVSFSFDREQDDLILELAFKFDNRYIREKFNLHKMLSRWNLRVTMHIISNVVIMEIHVPVVCNTDFQHILPLLKSKNELRFGVLLYELVS